MSYLEMSFGDRLQRRLSELNMTQKELADKLSISTSTMSNYVREETQPDFETTKKIANILDTTVEYLLTGKKVTPSQLIGELATQLEDSRKRELFERLIQLTPDNLELAADQLDAILKRQNKEK